MEWSYNGAELEDRLQKGRMVGAARASNESHGELRAVRRQLTPLLRQIREIVGWATSGTPRRSERWSEVAKMAIDREERGRIGRERGKRERETQSYGFFFFIN